MKIMTCLIAAILSLSSWVADARSLPVEFSDRIQVSASWETGPVLGDESRLRLQWSQGGAPFRPEAFRVKLWMPAHGHGSSPVEIREARQEDGSPVPGAFLVNKMYFVMEGAWEVRIALKFADGSEEVRSLGVILERGKKR